MVEEWRNEATLDNHPKGPEAFDANGIKFAFPTVQLAGDGEPATAAVAREALALVRPQAAE